MGFQKYEGEFENFSEKVKEVVDALTHSVTNGVAVVFDKATSADNGLVARIRTQAAKLGHSVSVKTDNGQVVLKATRKVIGEVEDAAEEVEDKVEEAADEVVAEVKKVAPSRKGPAAK